MTWDREDMAAELYNMLQLNRVQMLQALAPKPLKTAVRKNLCAGSPYAVLSARRAAPEPAITTTIRNTPRTTDCQ